MMIELSVVKFFTLLCKLPSKVSLYGSLSPKIAGLVEYTKGNGKHKFHLNLVRNDWDTRKTFILKKLTTNHKPMPTECLSKLLL